MEGIEGRNPEETLRLIVRSGPAAGREVILEETIDSFIIGSSQRSCQLCLQDPALGDRHAEVFRMGPLVLMRGLREKGSIKLNGQPMDADFVMNPGDIIEMGTSRIEVSTWKESGDERTTSQEAQTAQAVTQGAGGRDSGIALPKSLVLHIPLWVVIAGSATALTTVSFLAGVLTTLAWTKGVGQNQPQQVIYVPLPPAAKTAAESPEELPSAGRITHAANKVEVTSPVTAKIPEAPETLSEATPNATQTAEAEKPLPSLQTPEVTAVVESTGAPQTPATAIETAAKPTEAAASVKETKTAEPAPATTAEAAQTTVPQIDADAFLSPLELKKLVKLQHRTKELSPSQANYIDNVLSLIAKMGQDTGASVGQRCALIRNLGNYPSPKVTRSMAFLLNDRDENVQLALVEAFQKQDNPEAANFLATMILSPSQQVSYSATRALRRLQDADSVEWMFSKALLGTVPEVLRSAIASALLDIGDERSVQWLTKGLKDSAPSIRACCAKALGHYRSAEASGALAECADDIDPQVRASALLALGCLRDPLAEGAMIKHLKDPVTYVRSAAAKSLAALRHSQTVPSLISALEAEQDWVRNDIRRSLTVITGETFESGPSWRSWWDKRKDGFQVPPLETVVGVVQREDKKAITYYGIRVNSSKVIFVVDMSGSMVGAKLQEAKKQLKGAVGKFDPRCYFNVIFFGDWITAWETRLQQATPPAKDDALRFVDNMNASGGTNIYDAVMEAMKDQYVDTIFLLTDGVSTIGSMTDPGRMLASITSANRRRGVQINCVGLGDHDREFLQELAYQNNGTYMAPAMPEPSVK